MFDYYLIVEIEYVDYNSMSRGKVKIKRVFDKQQVDLELPLMCCVSDFYDRKNDCDICSINVIENSLL